MLGALAPRAAQDFIRAFSTYFQMVNMAEKVHRIRRRREYLRDASTPQPFGFEDTLIKLKALGATALDIEAALQRIRIEPIFTAHPTEATRRTLLRKQQRIARILMETLDPYMSPQEDQAALGRIRMEMTTGWQTEEHPGSQMTVGDEAEHVLFFLTDVVYRMIPPFYEELEQAFGTVFSGPWRPAETADARALRLVGRWRYGRQPERYREDDSTVTCASAVAGIEPVLRRVPAVVRTTQSERGPRQRQ